MFSDASENVTSVGNPTASTGFTQRKNDISLSEFSDFKKNSQSAICSSGTLSSQLILGSMAVICRNKILPRTIIGDTKPKGSNHPLTTDNAARFVRHCVSVFSLRFTNSAIFTLK